MLLYIVAASEDDETLYVFTSVKKAEQKAKSLGDFAHTFHDLAAGKARSDIGFELADAKVGDTVWVGHYTTDAGDGTWVTAPCRSEAEAYAAATALCKSKHLPKAARAGGGELRAIQATVT